MSDQFCIYFSAFSTNNITKTETLISANALVCDNLFTDSQKSVTRMWSQLLH